jgi:hypothetical protein
MKPSDCQLRLVVIYIAVQLCRFDPRHEAEAYCVGEED